MADAPPPAPPPVISVPSPSPQAATAVVEWSPGVVRCALKTLAPTRIEPPNVVPTTVFGDSAKILERAGTVALTFAIDKLGRPVSIRRDEADVRAPTYMLGDSSDLEPSLAASAFPAGAQQSGCRISYAPTITSVASASPELIARGLTTPNGRLIWRDVNRRWTAEGATCFDRPMRPLNMAFPDLMERKGSPGRWDRAAYRFDIGPDGVPTNIVSMFPNGTTPPDIDAEMRRALGASRFAAEARKGCYFGNHFPAQGPLLPPERAPLPSFAIKGAKCPFPASSLLKLEHVPFPESFRRRNIEGWAIVRFDLAPWGAAGNVSVVAAEPSAVFGEQAAALIRRAKMAPSTAGYSGCIAPVSYRTNDAPPGVIGADGTRVEGETIDDDE